MKAQQRLAALKARMDYRSRWYAMVDAYTPPVSIWGGIDPSWVIDSAEGD